MDIFGGLMNLIEYIGLSRGNATKLAAAQRVSSSYISQLARGNRAVSPTRAIQIEDFTNGAVTRRDLRPNDWHLIWPELADKPEAEVPNAA